MVLDNFILDNPDSVAAFILPFLEADKEAINYIKNYEFSMNKVISFFAMELDGFKVTKGENYLTYVDKKNMENYIGIMYVEKQYLKEYQMVEENTDTTLINLEGLEIIKYEYEIEGIGYYTNFFFMLENCGFVVNLSPGCIDVEIEMIHNLIKSIRIIH